MIFDDLLSVRVDRVRIVTPKDGFVSHFDVLISEAFPELEINDLRDNHVFSSGGPAIVGVQICTTYSADRIGRPDRFPLEFEITDSHEGGPTGLELAIVTGGAIFAPFEFFFLHYGAKIVQKLRGPEAVADLQSYIYLGQMLAQHDPK